VALILAAGYSANGLWKIVERSFVWHTVSRLVGSFGLGISVLVVVVMFGWKLSSAARNRVRK